MFANSQMMGVKPSSTLEAPAPAPAREKDEQDLQGNAAVQGNVTDTAKQQAAGTPTLDMVGPMGVPLGYDVMLTPNNAPAPIPYPVTSSSSDTKTGKKKGREI